MNRPPALVICNCKYEGDFEPLPWAMKDAVEVAYMLDKLGYHVIEGFDLSESELMNRVRRLVEELQGFSNPTIPIYYAGHGIEVAGTQFLVPIDAQNCSGKLISLDTLMECPGKAYLETDSNVKPLYFCILDACRSQPSNAADKKRLGEIAASHKKQVTRRKRNLKPDFVVLKACESGHAAHQCPNANHGLLTKAFLKYGWLEFSLAELLTQMMKKVQDDARDEKMLQKPEQSSTGCDLQHRFLRTSMEPASRSTSASCIDVSFLSSGSRGEAPAVMASAMQAMQASLLNATPPAAAV